MNQSIQGKDNELIITLMWLENIVEEMNELTDVWPYLTIKGYINDSKNESAATLKDVVRFMENSSYKLIYVHSGIKDQKEIVFKKQNTKNFSF